MTKKEEIIFELENNVWARERSNKNLLITEMLQEKYADLLEIDTTFLTEVFKEFSSLDRAWRLVTNENELLRGSDYNDKEELEKEAIEIIYV